MSILRVITHVALLMVVVAVGCSSPDQAAINKAVSATMETERINLASAATPTPTAVPVAPPTTVPTATSTTSQRLTDISSSSRSEQLSLLPTPFQNQTDYWALQPFVVQANQLEMQFHNGFDYFTDRNKVAVQAVSTGRVMFVEIFERARDGASQINLAWQSPSGEVVLYTLEPSAGPADDTKIAEQKILAQKMMESMTIQAGDDVRQGEFIGYLYGQDEWAHVHMTVKASNNGPEEWLCPADFITKAKDTDLLSKSLIWAEHLYKDSKQPELCNY
jgi:hypothetical protein